MAVTVAVSVPAAPRRHGGPLLRVGLSIAVLVVLALLWQLATITWRSPFFPEPWKILLNMPKVLSVNTAGGTSIPFFSDVLGSLGRMLAGYALGCVWGVVAGSVLGRWRAARDYTNPIVEFLRSVPATAVLPIFILLFGLGQGMQIAFIAWGVSWFVLINTASGVASMHKTLLDVGRAFRLSPARQFFGLVLPSASPKIFAGLRIGLTAAMILIVTSEFLGATNGIGFQLIQTQRRFQLVDMWSWMVVLAVLGYLLNTVLELVEARVLRWHANSRR